MSEEKNDKTNPIGSYVKLCSAVVTILGGGRTYTIHFWKGNTQGLLWPSVVPIGQVVSEE